MFWVFCGYMSDWRLLQETAVASVWIAEFALCVTIFAAFPSDGIFEKRQILEILDYPNIIFADTSAFRQWMVEEWWLLLFWSMALSPQTHCM